MRRAAVAFARNHGVPGECLYDFGLVASEAVTNAVLHAFRCHEHPGTVTVSVTVSAGEGVELVVSDDGMGMSPRDDSPGLGLGLGLIASLVDRVEYRTPRDGVGSEISMWFRLEGADDPSSQTEI